MTTREIYNQLGDAATKLAAMPEMAGVIVLHRSWLCGAACAAERKLLSEWRNYVG